MTIGEKKNKDEYYDEKQTLFTSGSSRLKEEANYIVLIGQLRSGRSRNR